MFLSELCDHGITTNAYWSNVRPLTRSKVRPLLTTLQYDSWTVDLNTSQGTKWDEKRQNGLVCCYWGGSAQKRVWLTSHQFEHRKFQHWRGDTAWCPGRRSTEIQSGYTGQPHKCTHYDFTNRMTVATLELQPYIDRSQYWLSQYDINTSYYNINKSKML